MAGIVSRLRSAAAAASPVFYYAAAARGARNFTSQVAPTHALLTKGARTFSSKSPMPPPPPEDEVKVKVPLAMYSVHGKDASSLFVSAVKANALDKVELEISKIVGSLKTNPEVADFFKDYSKPRKERLEGIEKIFAAEKLSAVTKEFLVYLAEKNRLRHIGRIAEKFVELTNAHKGIVSVSVTTVIPLPEQEEKDLKQIMQSLLGKDKSIKLEQKIDKTILGGLMVEYQWKLFDYTVKTRAKQIAAEMRETIQF